MTIGDNENPDVIITIITIITFLTHALFCVSRANSCKSDNNIKYIFLNNPYHSLSFSRVSPIITSDNEKHTLFDRCQP